MMAARLQRGDYVRVRMDGDKEWTDAFVALASESNPSSVVLLFDGVVRGPSGALVGNELPLTIDYQGGSITGLMGGEYEIEVAK